MEEPSCLLICITVRFHWDGVTLIQPKTAFLDNNSQLTESNTLVYVWQVCSLLLAHGADPTLPNCHNKAAVDVAQRDLQVRLHYEFKGHQVLEAARQADVPKLKRSIAGDNSTFITFKHPFTGDTGLVSRWRESRHATLVTWKLKICHILGLCNWRYYKFPRQILNLILEELRVNHFPIMVNGGSPICMVIVQWKSKNLGTIIFFAFLRSGSVSFNCQNDMYLYMYILPMSCKNRHLLPGCGH